METNDIYLHFHIGRGGHYNNAGYVTFQGERDFQQLLSYRSEHLDEVNRDEKGRFCKPYLIDGAGNGIDAGDDWKTAKTGRLNFDNDYDTDDVVTFEECTRYYEKYMNALARAYPTSITEVDKYLEENRYVDTEEEEE
jgi:hypothetical protein